MESAQVQKHIGSELKQNISTVIMGKDAVIEKVILSLLCGGHILLEDIPGTGKTTLAKALAKSIRCGFKRVQFTPDLLPSDLTGINFFNQKEGEFVFKEGSVFTNILLGDEINRATPRTQSSLLECMEEGQVSVDGVTYPLAKPFLVIATQNPIEIQGTFPLPEAQLDRFFVKLKVGYPAAEDEAKMLTGRVSTNPLDALEPVLDRRGDRGGPGRSPAGSGGTGGGRLYRAPRRGYPDPRKGQAGGQPPGRTGVDAGFPGPRRHGRHGISSIPEDVKAVVPDVWSHRIICKGFNLSQSSGRSRLQILDQILRQTEAPTEAAAL